MVLIAAQELLGALQQHSAAAGIQLLSYTDTDALRALDAITRRRPSIVALDHTFASTPRGTALINRIKADPSLADLEIRIVSPDAEHTPSAVANAAPAATGTATTAVTPAPPRGLDVHGTRRAPRFKVAGSAEILIDGNRVSLVDLSLAGAQVVSATVLRPNQRVRVSLADHQGTLRVNGSVAWAAFEIPAKIGPQYRAGIEFLGADEEALDAYCKRHREPPV